MLITRVELENIKSYQHLIVDFRRGTTAIQGANGAGKTTLVEAIGFALFNYLPYNQAQFVREGQKYGSIVVHLVGSDDRPYEVERRCGAGASWIMYDREADSKCEQRADVLYKLHEVFGIDKERPLETLFKDALGVPQGTFTAIFLEAAGKRKSTFDELLQIEDYKTASDYLLEVQKYYQEQAQVQQSEIQRLSFETRDLEDWRARLKEERLLDRQQAEQVTRTTQLLGQLEARSVRLTQQRDELTRLEHRYEQSKQAHETARQRLHDRQQERDSAQAAQQAVEASSADYQRYQQVEETLKGLRQDERKRNALQQQHTTLHRSLATIQANIANLQVRLNEVAAARQRIVDLSPQVEQQVDLERRREELALQVKEYERQVKEGKRLAQQQATYQKQQEGLTQRIAQIEPLQPCAALLTERVETVARLRAQVNERGSLQRQLQEKREQVRQKSEEREKLLERLRKAESNIGKIEEHRAEAEEMPDLLLRNEQIAEQRHRLEGNIETYLESRSLSVGGQCPFLHEPCLNIKRQGIVSLESYFDGLLATDQPRLDEITRQQTLVAERTARVKKYADALDKLGQYVDQREATAEQLQRLAVEITRMERDVRSLEQDLEELKRLDQQIARAEQARDESQQAEQQVRGLDGLHMQVQQLQEQIDQCEVDLQERRQQVQEFRGSGEQLARVKEELEALNDPLGQTKAQREVIKQEPAHQQQLQAQEEQQQGATQQIQGLDQQLTHYANLDMRIGEQETLLLQSLAGYQTYLQNVQTARLLPEREQLYQQAFSTTEQARQALETAEQLHQRANAEFHPEELEVVSANLTRLRAELERLGKDIEHTQANIKKLEHDIERTEALVVELEAAQQEQRTLQELQAMTEQFRKLIREAAPQILRAMLADISAEANRIFGEIMGDRSAQLSWQDDYEIILRRQGVNRTFAQLSGGEQMSAALSVRLALLKKLSSLNIAFFDEPTQNMDELRRMNLAEQIRRVRGFDQLIVISHDDTFEQGLDSLVRLKKVDGQTHMVAADEIDETEMERVQVQAHAS
ncbi:MAG: SMC family ATPase [Ktedonobacteraceae bacterium]